MAFCKNCGQQMNDDAVFCANCGTPVENTQQPQQAQQNYQQAPVQPTVVTGDADVQQNRGIAWLAYVLWAPVFLDPLFVKKTSEYCKFHVKQGATLWATHFAYWLVTTILTTILDVATRTYYYGFYVHSGIYHVFNVLFSLGNIFFVVMMIIGIVNAAKGQKTELPLISKIPFVANLLDKIYASINK